MGWLTPVHQHFIHLQCVHSPLVLLLLIHNIFIPSVFLMKLEWHVWKWLQKIILYSLFQCIFLGEYEVSQKTSISHYSPYRNKKAILLKKSHHHHNIPSHCIYILVPMVWHTNPIKDTQKLKKGDAQICMIIMTHLLCILCYKWQAWEIITNYFK